MAHKQAIWQRWLAELRQACASQSWPEVENLLAQGRAREAGHSWLAFGEGYYYQVRGETALARAAFRRAGDLYEAKLNLALLEREQGQYLQAAQLLEGLLTRQPWQLPLWQELTRLLQLTGQREALSRVGTQLLSPEATQLFNDHGFGRSLTAWLPRLEAMLLIDDFAGRPDMHTLPDQLNSWAKRHLAGLQPLSPIYAQLPDPDRRLRLGFISREWGAAPVELGFSMLFEQLDKAEFDLLAYCDEGQPRQAEHFSQIVHSAELDAYDFYARVQRDAVDVLIDLSGLFNPSRLSGLALRPAPVQVLAGANPPFVPLPGLYQGVLSDPVLMPPALTEAYSERTSQPEPFFGLSSFFYWAPPLQSPEPSPLPMLTQSGPVFGTLGSPNKITPATLELWARVLNAIPAARLVLKNQAYSDDELRAQLSARFRAAGGDVERLAFEDNRRQGDFFGFLLTVDIVLDTWPYGGALSSCDAYWMGVPVISLRGGHRIAESISANLGLEDFLATHPDDYVRRVTELVTEPLQLAQWRSRLRGILQSSAICDGALQAREFSSVCRKLWQDWCRG